MGNYSRYAKKPALVKQPRVIRAWSHYQGDIFNEVAYGNGNTHVDALAGSGKTSTLVESFYHVPSGLKTLMVAFNKSIQQELELRAPDGVDVKTLHALGFAACKRAFPKIKLDNDKLNGYIVAMFGDEYETAAIRENIAKAVSLAKSCLAFEYDQIDPLLDQFNIDTCDMPRASFIVAIQKLLHQTKVDIARLDFNDMIWFPVAHNLSMIEYDRVMVDEAQDLNACQHWLVKASLKPSGRLLSVGDANQCVEENTLVETPNGDILIKDLNIGDKILSYRNGKNVFQTVSKIWKSSKKEGLKIETASGKKLTLTHNHQIWGTLPVLSENETIVYLMYRSDLGFRVGITNKGYSKTRELNLSSRLIQETGEKMWILEICPSRSDAKLAEISYSLKYGIPTLVFNGEGRGLDQNYINAVFAKFGKNGINLLNDLQISFELPHWTACSSIKRSKISFCEHGPKGSFVSFEWSEDKKKEISSLLEKEGFTFCKAKKSKNGLNRLRIRRWCYKNNEALLFAKRLSSVLKVPVSRTMSTKDARIVLLNASSLRVGMSVLTQGESGFNLDKIVSIENASGNFIDIEVNDAANFYGNKILSHNCIYAFAGADINSIDNICKEFNSKRLPLSVTYRCAREIVKLAQELVPQLEAAPNAEDGLVEDVEASKLINVIRHGDFILSRTNAPLIRWCLDLLKAGTRANIAGRDLGKNLAWLITKSKAKDVDSFLDWLNDYVSMETDRLVKSKRDPSVVADKAECLRSLCEGTRSLDEVRKNIDHLFHDGDEKDRVMLSTIHKAKGLERDRVAVLTNTLKPSKGGEEANLAYIAYTRARKHLCLIK